MSVISRLYDNYSDAARAVSELERAGVPHDDISIVANNSEGWYSDDNRGSRRVDRDGDGVGARAGGAGIGAAIGGTAARRAGLGHWRSRAWVRSLPPAGLPR